MKFMNPLRSKEMQEKMGGAKNVVFGFVFVLALIFLFGNTYKVEAGGTTDKIVLDNEETVVNVVVNGTTYDKYSKQDGLETFPSVEIGDTATDGKNYYLTFIQGDGSNNVDMNFTIYNFPKGATSLLIAERGYTDSSDNADSDRYSIGKTYNQSNDGDYLKVGNLYYYIDASRLYESETCEGTSSLSGTYFAYRTGKCIKIEDENRYYKNGADGWGSSESNSESSKLEFGEDEDGKIYAKLTYRIRKGSYGLSYIRIFFYKGEIGMASPADHTDVFFVIARPIDTVSQGTSGTSCTKNDTICTSYVNGTLSREPKKLNLYIPSNVAYDFKTVSFANALANYQDRTQSTVYAINYFIEEEGGDIKFVNGDALERANRKYLYTNFEMLEATAKDTTAVVKHLVKNKGAMFGNYVGEGLYTANEIDYLQMEVDATGSYFFYLTDIFGNVTNITWEEQEEELRQFKFDVNDVKNRSIETKVLKGNANDVYGYGAEENFTNDSVKVTLSMEVKTNFQHGQCLDDACVETIVLNSSNIKIIKFWRVDVTYKGENDKDAFDVGDTESEDSDINGYGYQKHAAVNSMYYLVCSDANDDRCKNNEVLNFEDENIKQPDISSFGTVGFNGDNFELMIGLNGRYRFYIEDIYSNAAGIGNNTEGSAEDPTVGEYRNPRVEVYAIDKDAPNIAFNHAGTQGGLTKFDIETYEYYTALSQTVVKYVEIKAGDRYNYSEGTFTQNNEGGYLCYNGNCYEIENARRYNYTNNAYVRDNNGTYLQIFVYDAKVSGAATSAEISDYIY